MVPRVRGRLGAALLITACALTSGQVPAQQPGATSPASAEPRPAVATPMKISPAPTPIVDDGRRSLRAERLTIHGVASDTAALVAFLRDGFPPSATAKPFPAQPNFKTDVYLAAIEELGMRRERLAVEPLLGLVEDRAPQGFERVLARDLEAMPVEKHELTRRALTAAAQQNAVAALGLIGDERAAEPIARALAREKRPALTVEAAIALGMLGRGDGVGPLVAMTSDVATDEASAAFEALYFVTGRNYGISNVSSLERRRRMRAELEAWRVGEGRAYRPDGPEVLRRRLAGVPAVGAMEPDSLKAMIRMTRNPLSQSERIAARGAMMDRAKAEPEELRMLAADPLEDSDVRVEAARWYAGVEQERARKFLQRLAKDENAPVAAAAKALVRQLDRERDGK